MARSSGRPTGVDFYDPVLYLLGKFGGFRPNVGVSPKQLRDAALALRGIDYRSPPEPLHGNSPPGLYRKVHFAWRYMKDETDPRCCAPAPGLWGLTARGVEAAQDVAGDRDAASRGCVRWSSYFPELFFSIKAESSAHAYLDPVIYLIGKMSGFRAHVEIASEHVVTDAPRLIGIEDTDAAREHVCEAWHVQTRRAPGEEPLCTGRRGRWALSVAGVKRARALCEKYEGRIVLSCGSNETARYIGENFDRFYGRITNHLKTRMPRSEVLGKIDDHAMGWIEKVIGRDGLRQRVQDGGTVAPSQMCAWARRGAYSEIRNDGREPVCRVFHGALTPREIPAYDPSNWTREVMPRTINESEQMLSHTYAEHSENDSASDPLEHLTDGLDAEGKIGSVLDFKAVLDCISEVLVAEIDDEADLEWHRRVVVDRYVKEMTVDEIAEEYRIPVDETSRITGALKRVKTLMRRAREHGDLDDIMSS